MKIALVAMFLATSTLAQAHSAALPAACGPKKANFDVKLDISQHTPAQPEPGKAVVYFIQDAGTEPVGLDVYPISRLGVDGVWVGSNQKSSDFSISIEPGEHHMCATATFHLVGVGQPVALASFTAEAGKTYYYRTRLRLDPVTLDFDRIDSDQAKYQIASFPLSVSTPKK